MKTLGIILWVVLIVALIVAAIPVVIGAVGLAAYGDVIICAIVIYVLVRHFIKAYIHKK